MESIWIRREELPNFQSLTSDKNTEAVVIGGGMAGILTAYLLKHRGVSVILLEADRIGWGQTKNTTAKIALSHNLLYDKLIQKIGREAAGLYLGANWEAILKYEQIITEHNIECMFERVPSFLYSVSDREKIEKEVEAVNHLGCAGEFTTITSLPFPVEGAIRYPAQAQFHPLLFLEGIARDIEIYEKTRVLRVEEHRVITEAGPVVEAEHVIFATHYPFINRPGYYFMRMHQERSYAVAFSGVACMDGMYLGTDAKWDYSFRNSGEFLILGGEGHRTGENLTDASLRKLRDKAALWWPQCRTEAMWSAQDCMSPDQIPYIGRYSARRPYWYVATGFSKWGMSSSMVAAMLISDLIRKVPNPWEEVFSPQRGITLSTAKHMAVDGTKAAAGLLKRAFAVPDHVLENLTIGEGGIVDMQGQKVGVYKREDGKVFTVSVRCPHLGCQLEWNAQEKSWDCPCHGSRFSYKGKLIDNPAQNDIGGMQDDQ